MATARTRGPGAQGPKLADTWPIVVTTINGMSFVGGLHWHNIKKINSYMKEAQVNGAAWAADVVAFRTASNKTKQIQAGFAPKRAGAFKGMYSWAAAVAAVVGDNCLAGFKIDDNSYGIVCQLNGLIVAGSDRIVPKDEFNQLYRSIYNKVSTAQNKVTRLIAPAEFGVAEEELDIAAILTSKNVTKAHRLKALKRFDYTAQEIKKYTVIGGFGLLALYGCYTVYQGYEAKKAAAAQVAKNLSDAIDKRNREAIEAANEAKNVYPHKWINLASPSRMLEVCMPAMRPPLSVGGWFLEAASCSTDDATPNVAHVAYTYTRPSTDAPTWDAFKSYAESIFHVAPVASDSTFTKATIGLATRFEGSGDDALLPDGDETKGALISHFQQHGEAVSLSPVDPIKPAPDNPHPPRQEWTELTFSTAAAGNPPNRLTNLALSGVRITSLLAAVDKDKGAVNWTINGSLYVKR